MIPYRRLSNTAAEKRYAIKLSLGFVSHVKELFNLSGKF